jgi:hypothetical protein
LTIRLIANTTQQVKKVFCSRSLEGSWLFQMTTTNGYILLYTDNIDVLYNRTLDLEVQIKAKQFSVNGKTKIKSQKKNQ